MHTGTLVPKAWLVSDGQRATWDGLRGCGHLQGQGAHLPQCSVWLSSCGQWRLFEVRLPAWAPKAWTAGPENQLSTWTSDQDTGPWQLVPHTTAMDQCRGLGAYPGLACPSGQGPGHLPTVLGEPSPTGGPGTPPHGAAHT